MTDTAGTRPAYERRVSEKGVRYGCSAVLLGRRPWARATLLLTARRLAWFLLVYVASLVILLITAFWSIKPVHHEHRQDLVAVELPADLHHPGVPVGHLADGRKWPPR